MKLAPGFFKNSKPARATLNVPMRSISTTVRKAFDDMPSAGATKLPAAPETSTSIGPSFSLADFRTASTSA